MLKGKKIVLGVTGSIAAYKAAILVRLLVREGAEVQVLMTPLAKQFITPLTMATLSRRPILVEFFNPENGQWNSHVSLGEWADAMVVAPATANTMAKMATGVADNLLLTTYLSARCPVFVAPAMDLDMYAHDATQRNMEVLRQRGVRFVAPGEGELASGLVGKGRMAEPEEIVTSLAQFFASTQTLAGKRVLVTAGPTVEPIDPVRYISNRSTGKMGYALAAELADRGAEVVLVSGPTALATPHGVRRIDVQTAAEMCREAQREFGACDAAVMCAAVADYTPSVVANEKVKKGSGTWNLELRPTTDIAAALGADKGNRLLVGFALETNDERAHAGDKLRRKNFDFIVLNSLRDAGAGFGYETNKISIYHRDGRHTDYPLKSKQEVAADIVDTMESYLTK